MILPILLLLCQDMGGWQCEPLDVPPSPGWVSLVPSPLPRVGHVMPGPRLKRPAICRVGDTRFGE